MKICMAIGAAGLFVINYSLFEAVEVELADKGLKVGVGSVFGEDYLGKFVLIVDAEESAILVPAYDIAAAGVLGKVRGTSIMASSWLMNLAIFCFVLSIIIIQTPSLTHKILINISS